MTQDKAQEAMVESLMSGDPEQRERFIIETLLDIKNNGCAKACHDQGLVRPHIMASGVATTVSAIVIGILEYFRNK